ncbi:cell wall-binding repeat-containing protein [Clostridium scatologenes]|uniref:Putative cell wall binding repeat 2-containing protein n=1 Tax=Clostridium scatologenes TaxID=1548 RepID=A0A0E3K1T3_CLOSL|nr:cell wall-binding repeat-containing protein [Clostridium scatologenes]AKA70287.1 putative cell wall binding repeat 2-containing protein [Clostridium scatologenes]
MIRRRKNIAILILTFVLGTAFPRTVQASFPTMKRLGGSDRYDTCIKVAQDGWSSSYYAVIACGENYPDALSSVPLAKKYDAPILLTYSNSMPANVMDEIKQLHVGKVFLIGGQGSISSSVEKQLQNQGIQTERLAGADRYETSVKIAEKFGKVEALTVSTGEDYADALSIGPAAAAMGVPVLLVPKNYVPDVTKKYIRNLNTIRNSEYDNTSNSSSSSNTNTSSGTFRDYHVFVMGDSNIVTDNVVDEFQGEGNTVERIEGKDKYYRNINAIGRFIQKSNGTSTQNKDSSDDNNKQAQYFVKGDMLSINNLYLASGEGFADALSGAALAAKTKSPIILSASSNSEIVKDFILNKIPNYSSNSVNPEYLTVLGGEGVMPGTRVSQIFGNIAFDNAISFPKSDSDTITFKNKSFEKLIRNKLNIQDRNIYFSDVKGITSLDLTNQNIADISGLENFIHLKSLNLSYNQIKNLSPIVRLDELENLNLSHNNIEDVSYISNLVNLKELNLSDNQISSSDLDHSRNMYKDTNQTEYDRTSDNVFKKLNNIVSLDLSNSILNDYSNNRNRINDISNLKDMTSLVSLNLNGNNVNSLSDLQKLTNLNTLKLSYTGISDLDFIKKLTNITYLDISNNSSIDGDDLNPLKNLTNLKYLNASNDKIDNVSALSSLTKLTTLYIEDNPIQDYTPILDITKSLYYKDFDLSSSIGNSSYDSEAAIDTQIKDEIYNFQSMYSYGDYTKLKYRKLYHAYDLGTYDGQLQDLYRNRDWITYEISLGGITQENINSFKNQLDSINYNAEEMSKKDSMNKKVKDLEIQFLSTSKPIEKEKLIGKINYIYADYRYDYYRNLVQKYNNDVEKIKEQIQEASYETPNYSSNKDIKNLQHSLEEIQKDIDLASQKISMYQNYKDFFNAVDAVLEEI